MQNEKTPPKKVKINRKLQIERAAQARAKITAYLNGATSPATVGDLNVACSDIKGVDMSNIVGRMVQNDLLSKVKLEDPVGRSKVGYTLFNGAAAGKPPSRKPVHQQRKATAKLIKNTVVKPIVTVTDKDIVVDYSHMRVVIQVVPT